MYVREQASESWQLLGNAEHLRNSSHPRGTHPSQHSCGQRAPRHWLCCVAPVTRWKDQAWPLVPALLSWSISRCCPHPTWTLPALGRAQFWCVAAPKRGVAAGGSAGHIPALPQTCPWQVPAAWACHASSPCCQAHAANWLLPSPPAVPTWMCATLTHFTKCRRKSLSPFQHLPAQPERRMLRGFPAPSLELGLVTGDVFIPRNQPLRALQGQRCFKGSWLVFFQNSLSQLGRK